MFFKSIAKIIKIFFIVNINKKKLKAKKNKLKLKTPFLRKCEEKKTFDIKWTKKELYFTFNKPALKY